MEKICNSKTKLKQNYGDLAPTIMSRLILLSATPNLDEVTHCPPPRRHMLHGEYQGMFAVDIKHPKRLIFRPVDINSSKEINLREVVSIEIIDIKDYH